MYTTLAEKSEKVKCSSAYKQQHNALVLKLSIQPNQA